jgi:hypothetical protein
MTHQRQSKYRTAARALQKRTGWGYTECIRCIRELTPAEIEALIILKGKKKS